MRSLNISVDSHRRPYCVPLQVESIYPYLRLLYHHLVTGPVTNSDDWYFIEHRFVYVALRLILPMSNFEVAGASFVNSKIILLFSEDQYPPSVNDVFISDEISLFNRA